MLKTILLMIATIIMIIYYKSKIEKFKLIDKDKNKKIMEMHRMMGNNFGIYEQYNKMEMFKKGMFILPNKWGVRSFNEEKWN